MTCATCGKENTPDRFFCLWCETYLPLPVAGTKAGVFRRAFASAIDPILISATLFGPPSLMALVGGRSLGLPLALISTAVVIVWFIRMYARGLTPGKFVLHEQVVDKLSGTNPGIAKMLLRETVGKFVSGLFFGVGFFWAIWDKDNQAWHDKIAGTVVVHRIRGGAAPVVAAAHEPNNPTVTAEPVQDIASGQALSSDTQDVTGRAQATVASLLAADERSPQANPQRHIIVVALAALVLLGATGVLSATNMNSRAALRVAEKEIHSAERRLAQTSAIAAEKDSILSELMATTSFINRVNEELAKIESARGGRVITFDERVLTLAQYRAEILANIEELGRRLEASDERLQASQRRLRLLAASDSAMTGRIEEFEHTIASYQQVIADQRQQISQLAAQVETLQGANARLAREKRALTEQYLDLAEAAGTVYYIAADRSALIELGIVTEEGGSRGFLGIGGAQGSLLPARELYESDFIPLSKTADTEITLPKPDRAYRIISRHNPKYLESVASDGTVRGEIRITNSGEFWAPSKFLILVEI